MNLTIDSVDTSVTELSDTELEADEAGASYQWLACDSGYSPISGDTNQQFSATSNGSYAVEVTKNGCTDTSSCHQITEVGIAENELESKVSVHPNPTTDKVTVEIPERKEKLHVVLRGASGRKISERDIDDPSNFQLELGKENGLYIVELRGDEVKNAVIRVVKE